MPDQPGKPRWRKPVLVVSASIAALTWLLIVYVQIFQGPADSMLWVGTVGWPVVYLFAVGVGLGMLDVFHHPAGTRRTSWFGLPRPKFVSDIFYFVLAPLLLIGFPALVLSMTTLMVVLVATGHH